MDLDLICFALLMFLVSADGGRARPEERCSLITTYGMLSADCKSKNLVSIPVQTRDVEILVASVNRIRVLKNDSFTSYRSLKFLYLNDNLITIIEAGAFAPLEDLEVLDLTLNAIRDLPATLPSTLRRLHLSENPLGSIPLGEAASLTFLNLSGCLLSELPYIGVLPMLLELNLTLNPLINLTVTNLASFCSLQILRVPIELISQPKYLSSCDCVRVKRWTKQHSISVIPALNCSLSDNEEMCIFNSTEEAKVFGACQKALQLHYARHWTVMACGVGVIIIIAVLLTLMWRKRRHQPPQPHRTPEQEDAFRTRKLLEEAPKSKF